MKAAILLAPIAIAYIWALFIITRRTLSEPVEDWSECERPSPHGEG